MIPLSFSLMYRKAMSTKPLFTLPDSALQKLRCSLCADYLSHFPVHTFSQIGSVCGRCPVLHEENPVHNEVYEVIAKNISFPCRYSGLGCLELLVPRDIVIHEDSCPFRQYFCPFMPSGCCPWQGPSNELIEHFQEKHRVFILEEKLFEIDFTSRYSENYLLVEGQNIFIVHKKSDVNDNLFWCAVSYVGSRNTAQQYTFQLVLSVKGNDQISYTFSPVPISCFINPNIDKNSAVEIDAEVIMKELNNPASVICNISIAEHPSKSSEENSNIQEKRMISVDSIEEDILNDLECPVCLEFMVPPIYQCETGHSVCSTCKSKINECPSCKRCYRDTRNFHLEKITNRIKYYCKYRDYDCTFVASAQDIKQHEMECKFGPYSCPLHDHTACGWKGRLTDIMEHVRHSHEDNMLELEVVTVPYEEADFNSSDEDCFVMQASGEIFRLLYKYENNLFRWAVELVGPAAEAENFMFILDIIDNTNQHQRLFLKRHCAPLGSNCDPFRNDVHCVKIPLDLINCMISNDLTYRIQIVSV